MGIDWLVGAVDLGEALVGVVGALIWVSAVVYGVEDSGKKSLRVSSIDSVGWSFRKSWMKN